MEWETIEEGILAVAIMSHLLLGVRNFIDSGILRV
jgi:hypothetical protein